MFSVPLTPSNAQSYSSGQRITRVSSYVNMSKITFPPYSGCSPGSLDQMEKNIKASETLDVYLDWTQTADLFEDGLSLSKAACGKDLDQNQES